VIESHAGLLGYIEFHAVGGMKANVLEADELENLQSIGFVRQQLPQ
jgi:hypothetical protein